MTTQAVSPKVEYVDEEVFPATSFLTNPGDVRQTVENVQRILRLLAQVHINEEWSESAEMGRTMLLNQVQRALNDVDAQHTLDLKDARAGIRRRIRH